MDAAIRWLLIRQPEDWPLFPLDIWRAMLNYSAFVPTGEPNRAYGAAEERYEADWAWLNRYERDAAEADRALVALKKAINAYKDRMLKIENARKRLYWLRERYMKRTRPTVGQTCISATEAEAKAEARAKERQGMAVLSSEPG
jgi:hypothetical protein